jgi:hypothetical protein
MRTQLQLALAASLITASSAGQATLLTVNPNIAADGITTFNTIASAVGVADADNNLATTYDVQITPGTYTNDFALVTRPMTLEGTGSGAVMQASGGQLLQQKGIIVIPDTFIGGAGQGLTVKNLTITGAAIDAGLGGNGAGIRDQAPGGTFLHVEDSKFIGNQDGILTGSDTGKTNQEVVEIISSTFQNNGSGTGQTHALYVGDALSLLVQNSIFCGTLEGHNVKSRAKSTTITGTQSFDGAVGGGCAGAGTTSYGFEFPNGGVVDLVNDTLTQGDFTHNNSMIGYGAEGYPYSNNTLSLVDTSLTSSIGGIGIQHFNATGSCTLQNSPISGPTPGFTNVSPADFCTSVTGPTPGPTPVNEPSTSWLLMTAALGWACAVLVINNRHQFH